MTKDIQKIKKRGLKPQKKKKKKSKGKKKKKNTGSEWNLAYSKPSKWNLGIHILDVKEKAFLYHGEPGVRRPCGRNINFREVLPGVLHVSVHQLFTATCCVKRQYSSWAFRTTFVFIIHWIYWINKRSQLTFYTMSVCCLCSVLSLLSSVE